ncbi:MAG TPA: type II toxin-antitoxin system VapC family toxin [Candidatus Angelobacter sp.]|nr:type II toxin-antitoxin system VapC family toxin [Candidatus Angelobacter sp.]
MLLDTHTLIWYLTDDPQLPSSVKEVISKERLVYVSAAVIWEIAIKGALGKLELGGKPIQSTEAVHEIIDQCISQRFEILEISASHAAIAPFLKSSHKDPFDRMIAAQAMELGLTLASADTAFDELVPGIQRFWAAAAAAVQSRSKQPKAVKKNIR